MAVRLTLRGVIASSLLVLCACHSQAPEGGPETGMVLVSPRHIPLRPNVRPARLNGQSQLKHFRSMGPWRSVWDEQSRTYELRCTTWSVPAVLLSTDRVLLARGDELQFDILVDHDGDPELGLIWGDRALISHGKSPALAAVDAAGGFLDRAALDSSAVWEDYGPGTWGWVYMGGLSSDTLDGPNVRLYMAGTCIDLASPPGPSTFGLYVGPNCRVRVRNFAWVVGTI